MKTAISLSDPLFERGERFARDRGVSRSELYARALAEYLDRHDQADTTARLNELYAAEDSTLPPEVAELGFETLRREGKG